MVYGLKQDDKVVGLVESSTQPMLCILLMTIGNRVNIQINSLIILLTQYIFIYINSQQVQIIQRIMIGNSRIYKKETLPNSQTIHYQEANPDSKKDQVLFFLHGNQSSQKCWNDAIDKIKSEGHRIIAIDMRGFGQTTYKTQCTSITDFSSDIIEFCKCLKIQKIVLIGWSFGGVVAKRVGEMKPELTSKVIFVCPAFCEESGKEGYRTKEEIEKNEMMAPYIEARNKKDVEFIRGAYASFYDSLSKEVEKEVLDDVFNQRNFVEVMVMIAAYDTMNFDNFKANALLIYGADDEIIPNQHTKKAIQNSGMKSICFEKGGHLVPVYELDKFIDEIKAFIK